MHVQLELYAWFLFDLLIKSAAKAIGETRCAWWIIVHFVVGASSCVGPKNLEDETARSERLGEEAGAWLSGDFFNSRVCWSYLRTATLMEDLRQMLSALAMQVKHNVDVQDSVELLNRSLAFLFHDLFAVLALRFIGERSRLFFAVV